MGKHFISVLQEQWSLGKNRKTIVVRLFELIRINISESKSNLLFCVSTSFIVRLYDSFSQLTKCVICHCPSLQTCCVQLRLGPQVWEMDINDSISEGLEPIIFRTTAEIYKCTQLDPL